MDYLQYYNKACSNEICFKGVLNLVINGLPSIHDGYKGIPNIQYVLNLVINGLPSIRYIPCLTLIIYVSF